MQITEAMSGQACLDILKEQSFDIIFLDHMMPGMDGIETFHAMRKMPENLCQDTPVIILTANAVIGAKENYLKKGFDAFLSKPVEPNKLEKMIYEMLPKDLVKEGYVNQKEIEAASMPQETIEFPIIDGVDFSYGRLHFPEDKDLLESFRLFYQMLDSDAKTLEGYYENMEYV